MLNWEQWWFNCNLNHGVIILNQGTGFLETLKNPANLFQNNLLITPGIILSLNFKKTKKRIVELLIPTIFWKKDSHEGTKTFLGKKNMGTLF